MDMEEKVEVLFSFDGAAFDDKASGEHLTLGGSGRAILNAAPPDDDTGRAASLIGTAAAKAVSGMPAVCDSYEKIPYRADELLNMLRVILRAEDAALSERIESVLVTGVWPDDESVARLVRGRKAKRETEAKAAAAERAAAEEEEKRRAAERAKIAAMRCPGCGADLSARPNVRFCPKCGAPRQSAASESPLAAYIRQNYTTATKVKAIAYYREQTGAGLAEAKRAVEKILEG